jgi:hypothetical protein
MRNKAKFILAAVALSTLGVGALATTAFADRPGWVGHHGGGMMRQMMQRYDANKDGKLTQLEIDDNRTEWFARFDADKNGNLNLKEFEALWIEANRQDMIREFQRFDPNGDAALSLDEYKEPLSRIVANRDRNGDGVLSKEDRQRGGKERWRRDRGPADDKDGSDDNNSDQ